MMYIALPWATVGDLKNFMPASCCLRVGFSLFSNASLYFAITLSKSAVLSGLIRIVITAASPSNVITGAGFASCAEATVAPASVKPASAIPETKTCNPRNIDQPPSRKVVTLPYCPADENRHYVISQKHAVPGQCQTASGLMDEQPGGHI